MILISYLIDKFKGKYRLLAPIDKNTMDFPRKINGTYEDIDVYIDCLNGSKIFHYGGSVLQAYIPSIGRGRNILKQIDGKIIFDVEESDTEVLFKFNYKNSGSIIPLLKPKTLASTRSPFSPKNLPKTAYEIKDEDLLLYKNIVARISPQRILCISQWTNLYLKSLVTKRNSWEQIRADMKLKGLKGKEYIHSIGKWNEYIKFLEKKIQEGNYERQLFDD